VESAVFHHLLIDAALDALLVETEQLAVFALRAPDAGGIDLGCSDVMGLGCSMPTGRQTFRARWSRGASMGFSCITLLNSSVTRRRAAPAGILDKWLIGGSKNFEKLLTGRVGYGGLALFFARVGWQRGDWLCFHK
jgi:hypothetical protein